MTFFIPLWFLIPLIIYSIGFTLTLLLLHILTKGEGDQMELIPISLLWFFSLPGLLFGIFFGILEKLYDMLK